VPFEAGAFNSVMATEVLEHRPNPGLFVGEARRVLVPGGLFFFSVPFLWNLHDVTHDEYRYTPFALKRLLEANSLIDPVIRATGDWHASLAQLLGLWVKRSGLTPGKRRLVSLAIKAAVQLLLTRDARTPVRFVRRQHDHRAARLRSPRQLDVNSRKRCIPRELGCKVRAECA
jgi:SAM-dependent methyltransferase